MIAGVLAGCGRTAVPRASVPTPASPTAAVAAGTRPILVANGPPVGPLAGLTARPVDPLTLADVPGAAPLSFALHYGITFGPGGRTLAVSSSPDAFTHTDSALQFIDFPTWTATPAAAIADDFLFGMPFSDDERYLYWLTTTRRDSTSVMQMQSG